MLRLPSRFAAVILGFAPLFFNRSWQRAQVLLLGAVLAPGTRTVTRLLDLCRTQRHAHAGRVPSVGPAVGRRIG